MKRLNFVLCLVCTLSISFAAHAATLRTVALSGQQVPGAPEGVNFPNFSLPVLNNAGQVAVQAGLTGNGVMPFVNSVGVLSLCSGSLALVARAGDHAPGEPEGVNFRSVGYNVPALGGPTLEPSDKSGLATCCGTAPRHPAYIVCAGCPRPSHNTASLERRMLVVPILIKNTNPRHIAINSKRHPHRLAHRITTPTRLGEHT